MLKGSKYRRPVPCQLCGRASDPRTNRCRDCYRKSMRDEQAAQAAKVQLRQAYDNWIERQKQTEATLAAYIEKYGPLG